MKRWWWCFRCNKSYKGDENDVSCRVCGSVDIYPAKINFRRVHGDHYKPYKGYSRWEKMANDSLAAKARDNWLRRQKK